MQTVITIIMLVAMLALALTFFFGALLYAYRTKQETREILSNRNKLAYELQERRKKDL